MLGWRVFAMMADVIATFRVARQTSRWSRFAEVTAEVVSATTDEVSIAQNVLHDESLRHEAVHAAYEVLRRVPAGHGRHRVTIVGAVTSEVDTGVGDVFDAATGAVRKALALAVPLPGGFSDPRIVASWLRGRIGQRLVAVTEAHHWYNGERDSDTTASLIHAWLHFEHRPPTQLHVRGDELSLSTAEPYDGHDMDDFGDVVVSSVAVPDLLASVVGKRLTDGAVILEPFDKPRCAGLLLRLDDVDVALGACCDEWVLALDQPLADLGPYWRPQPWITQT